jgi:hypothetical protein
MFKMYIQTSTTNTNTTVQPTYQPPVPNIRIKPLASTVSFGSIYAPIYSNGPCSSCGNSK